MGSHLPDIFLSYSRDDQATARRFAEGFERAGLSVWWDVTLNPGEAYDQVTEKALRDAKAVVVLWSKKSVDSRWVRAEATTADRNRTLVPVMIEPCLRPIMFELTHTADLSHWTGDATDKLWQSYLAGVRRFVDKDLPASESPAEDRHAIARVNDPSSAMNSAVERAPSIAVLPFANMSGDKEQEYFSDGLAEEILNALAEIPGLKVIARTSAFAFKGQNTDIRRIAETLGVDQYSGRERAALGQPDPRDRSTDHCNRWDPPVVRSLRPRDGGCLHGAGRDFGCHLRGAQDQTFTAGARQVTPYAHATCLRGTS